MHIATKTMGQYSITHRASALLAQVRDLADGLLLGLRSLLRLLSLDLLGVLLLLPLLAPVDRPAVTRMLTRQVARGWGSDGK